MVVNSGSAALQLL